MKIELLILNGFLLFACIDFTSCQGKVESIGTTRKWFVKPYHAAYGGQKGSQGSIDAQSNKGQNVGLNANKGNLAGTADVQGKGQFSAKRDGNPQQVQAKSAGGKTATADQSQKANGVRTADAGKHHGNLKTSKSGNDKNANLDLNTGQKMDTVAHGKLDSFDAAGNKGHKYNVDPSKQSKTEGAGTIKRDGETYQYKETRGSNGDTNAQLSNIGTGPNRKTYTCQGQKTGISNCVDQNGMKAGEVVAQKDGTVIVKKTVAKGVDVPIGKSKVQRTSDGKGIATVNDGLFQAQAGNYRQRDCMSDYGKKSSKVKVNKPFVFKYNSETTGGKRMFTFPDCMTYGGKVTLDPGVDANRLALQMDASILPAGKLKCVDPGSCNKDCYYCNLCNNSRKLDGLANSKAQNLCNAKGGQTVDVSVTMCPPPEAFNYAMCSGFTKSDPNYFKKKGDIQARILFWLRPANEAQKQQEFYEKLSSPAGQFLKKAWLVQFAIDNKNYVNANSPTDYDLKEWYIHKYGGADVLVACVEGTTNFTMTGQKVRTDFLLEAGSLAAAPKSLFDTKQCPKVDAINQQEAQVEAAEAKAKATTKAGFNWQKLFGGKK